MPPITPLADRLDGLLFFPVTAFHADGTVDLEAYRHHVLTRIESAPAAVFAACGTGEFPALDPQEYEGVVATAVAAAAGRVPVLAGCGYGTALARSYAATAERAGADGLLVLPPYSADGGQDGLLRHYRAVASATALDLILYQRDQVVFAPETVAELARTDNVIGFKDGRGDLDLMLRIVSAVRSRGIEGFRFFNGLPTAEMTQQAYRAIGVPLYSSAVFCFAPDVALAFHQALEKNDTRRADALIDVFFKPYVELRASRPGYAVSLVKALTRAAGHPVGEVRAPLTEPAPEHVEAALGLLADARRLLG